jgi:LemA protein
MITIWLLIVLLGLVGWLIYQFNTLVGLSNHVDAAWAEIDAQLARRYDLVARLMDLVKTNAPAQASALVPLDSARAAAMNAYTPGEKSRTEPPLAAGIATVLSVTRTIPALATNEEFLELQRTLTDIEDYLRGAFRAYNARAERLNGQASAFPDNFLASLFGVEPRELYQPVDP